MLQTLTATPARLIADIRIAWAPFWATWAVTIFLDFQLVDAAGPTAAFEEAQDETAPLAYRPRVIAPTAAPVRSSSSVQLVAEAFTADPIDTLIVAGGSGTRERLR
jgi:transcriptional regulator GlxA family with amidase domain